ncbi:MAG: HIT family protein [Myxococcota bacterium]
MSDEAVGVTSCLACDLLSGARPLPGGVVYETDHWIVEHCVGPLGVGTLVVKTRRHCVHVANLSEPEARQLGPLLARVAGVVQSLTEADQVYTCLWSHAGWEPGHIHFVIQPAWGAQRTRFPGPGPALQMALFEQGHEPDEEEVEAFCARARERLAPQRADGLDADPMALAAGLIEGWCARRATSPLRYALAGWPDEAGGEPDPSELESALRNAREFASGSLTEGEREVLDEILFRLHRGRSS